MRREGVRELCGIAMSGARGAQAGPEILLLPVSFIPPNGFFLAVAVPFAAQCARGCLLKCCSLRDELEMTTTTLPVPG